MHSNSAHDGLGTAGVPSVRLDGANYVVYASCIMEGRKELLTSCARWHSLPRLPLISQAWQMTFEFRIIIHFLERFEKLD